MDEKLLQALANELVKNIKTPQVAYLHERKTMNVNGIFLGYLYLMNVYDRVIPNKSYQILWILNIGVIIAILFEFITE